MGYEVYEHNRECRAIDVIEQDWSSEVVALFLEGWELGRSALSCHMAMDFPCQEMRDACGEDLRDAGSSPSLCSQCCEDSVGSLESPLSQQAKASPWTGCDDKGEESGEKNEGEGT